MGSPGRRPVIKKIHKSDLRLGMYIHDLNCGWINHGFWRQNFMLRREEDLAKILESPIGDVYIDTLKGLDGEGPSQQEVEQALSERLVVALTSHGAPQRRGHQEELSVARNVQREATQVVHSMLDDVRLGKQLQMDRLEPVVERITDSILRNQSTLLSLCRLKEADTYTFQHSVSVCTLLVSFCRHLGLDHQTIQLAGMGGMLHDVGKMRVPDHILNKPGKLTDREFEVMKSHVSLGMEILGRTPGISPIVLEIAGQHHERFSGTGYPDQLHGYEINRLGRMAAIVDVYDAITSNRVYHQGMEPAQALRKLFEWSEQHFDPELVQAFIHAVGIYPSGSLVRLESQRLAVILDQHPENLLHPVVRIVYDAKNRKPLKVHDLDLGDPAAEDRILGPEIPADWEIEPFTYLTLELSP
jgi:putative nucleotidyltransferase with HDIG domain